MFLSDSFFMFIIASHETHIIYFLSSRNTSHSLANVIGGNGCRGYRLDINASVRTPKPIRNPKCADIQKYRIFQVIDDGALAFACDSQYGNELCSGMVAYIPKMIDSNYYDELIVEPVGGQCISYEGVYKYSTKDGYNKTVPILKFITEQ